MPLFSQNSHSLTKRIVCKKIAFQKKYLKYFFKIYNSVITLDPDPNWVKILDPDLNSMYMDPQHCLTLTQETFQRSWEGVSEDHSRRGFSHHLQAVVRAIPNVFWYHQKLLKKLNKFKKINLTLTQNCFCFIYIFKFFFEQTS